ncbi:MAG: type II toxin-antitoxin system HicB family antitoxin [Clostridia bacterium]|nr:type II toxin-antitoxin system HicB family antitoxin [Clostridia bacterium]
MKTIEYYMALPYRMELVADMEEGGYVVSFPDLKGCISTGETVEQAVANANDARREWVSAALEDGYEIPEPNSDDEYSGQFKLRIPKSLHRQLAEHSRREGISMNQYCLYLLSRNDALAASGK